MADDTTIRKKLVFNQETEEDSIVSLSLRPARFDEFVGQKDVIDNLKVTISAAKQRGDSLEHMLFSGPPGVGQDFAVVYYRS